MKNICHILVQAVLLMGSTHCDPSDPNDPKLGSDASLAGSGAAHGLRHVFLSGALVVDRGGFVDVCGALETSTLRKPRFICNASVHNDRRQHRSPCLVSQRCAAAHAHF